MRALGEDSHVKTAIIVVETRSTATIKGVRVDLSRQKVVRVVCEALTAHYSNQVLQGTRTLAMAIQPVEIVEVAATAEVMIAKVVVIAVVVIATVVVIEVVAVEVVVFVVVIATVMAVVVVVPAVVATTAVVAPAVVVATAVVAKAEEIEEKTANLQLKADRMASNSSIHSNNNSISSSNRRQTKVAEPSKIITTVEDA